MRTLLASSTVLLTIAFSLALGIACGYAVVAAILNAIVHKPRKEQNASATAVIPIRSAASH
jgi:ABC-type Na+ efflux pump permease subunit